jgi:hypothetical protein
MKPKVIYTRTFSCDDNHPTVNYTFDKDNKVVCKYCDTQFVYEPKKTKTEEIIKILEENKITNVGKNTPYGRDEAMEISRRQSKKNKDERTHSEEMQDELEPIPIPCPMHEDYDEN